MQLNESILAQAKQAAEAITQAGTPLANPAETEAAIEEKKLDARYADVWKNGGEAKAFREAVAADDLVASEYFLKRGVEVNGGRSDGKIYHIYTDNGENIKPTVVSAAENGSVKMLDLLQRYYVDVDAIDYHRDGSNQFTTKRSNALIVAIDKNDKLAVDKLLGMNADVAMSDVDGRNAVHHAATASNAILEKVIDAAKQVVLDKDNLTAVSPLEKVDANHKSPLAVIISASVDEDKTPGLRRENIASLLRAGVDATSKDSPSNLSLAADNVQHGGYETAKQLLKYGANPEVDNPILKAASTPDYSGKMLNLHFIDLLLEKGVSIDAADENNGVTGLMRAAKNHDIVTTEYFLAKNAKVDLVNKSGKTSIDYAKQYGLFMTERQPGEIPVLANA